MDPASRHPTEGHALDAGTGSVRSGPAVPEAPSVAASASTVGVSHTWEEASSPEAERLAQQYEELWQTGGSARPDVFQFLAGRGSLPAGARLAVLRTDLGLRWQAGDRVRVEWYRDRAPGLPPESLVALIYEEFCLREEEQGRCPDPADFYRRFPALEVRLKRVLDIHGLVGHGSTTAFHPPDPATALLPEAGQTIAGFRLVEELGRGSFARVFRAEERQLADRPVALKVTRIGSREPQTLARLQHTNIVPIHSYRTDPATGLHLLCMPYFGRVTLGRLLEEPEVKAARQGSAILAVLDRLDPAGAGRHSGTADRRALEALPFARAIAWWGARLAEALQHAHDRGVLHRDLKPSNVLVTPDAQPMLLDFNLAQVEHGSSEEREAMGGTLAYMAPEHLEALAGGDPARVDARADIYALGVMLYEAVGSRPFATPSRRSGHSLTEVLNRTAADRRRNPPRLREQHPEVPPAFEAVVRRCLEPDPEDRYPTAALLAADLQAVADDRSLRGAREPIASRTYRWVRRHRLALALTVPVVLGVMTLAALYQQNQAAQARVHEQVDRLLAEGSDSELHGRYELAASHYQAAAELAEGTPALLDLFATARERYRHAEQARQVRHDADALLHAAERLRFGLLGFDAAGTPPDSEIEVILAPFFVLQHENWTERPELTLLDETRRNHLISEVEELLFLWAVSKANVVGDREIWSQGAAICQHAEQFSRSPDPWRQLHERFRARLQNRAFVPGPEPDPRAEPSAWASFQRALIHSLVEHEQTGPPLVWLDRSVALDPSRYWSQFYLAYFCELAGQEDLALAHYSAAIALRKDSPFALFARAGLYWRRGAWERALEDLNRAHALAQGLGFEDPDLERGLVRLRLGDLAGARADFDNLIDQLGPASRLGRSARLNRAWLAVEAGAYEQARAEYDELLAESPTGIERATIQQGRIELALRTGRAADALPAVAELLEQNPRQPAWQALWARVALALGQTAEAEQAARTALELDPGAPDRERLLRRALLAAGHDADLTLDDPAQLDELPGDRRRLRADLRAAADRLAGQLDPHALRLRAVLLAALRDPAARTVAEAAVVAEPRSERAHLIRGRILRHLGDRTAALADAEAGLAYEPVEPTLLELRGRLALDAGSARRALADFDRAAHHGGTPTLQRNRAEALHQLGQFDAAVEAWTRQIQNDPTDLAAFLGRARTHAALRAWDRALADLEAAASEAHDRPGAMIQVVAAYSGALLHRPDRLGRVTTLGLQALGELGPRLWADAARSDEVAD